MRRKNNPYGNPNSPIEYYFIYRKYFKFPPYLAALTTIDRFCPGVTDHARRTQRVEEYFNRVRA